MAANKKLVGPVLIIVFCLLEYFSFMPGRYFSWAGQSGRVSVAVLATESGPDQAKLILAAYEQVLNEEGFPYRVISAEDLYRYGGNGLKENFEALIVPEYLNSAMSPESVNIISEYIKIYGGQVLLSFDPATGLSEKELRPKSLLSETAGLDFYLTEGDGRKKPTYAGFWIFPSAEISRMWGITPGKLDRDNAVCSYSFGKLKFEHARATNVNARVIAFDRGSGENNPVITEKTYPGGGTAVYINIPLGKYKIRSDDLTLRSVLRSFLVKYAKAPRLLNSPGGEGGMVFNLHICSGAYNRALLVMLMQGLFQHDLPFSIHITAGPDTYKFGDNMGFFAESKYRGRPLLEVLQNYGEIGSHGGWAHNFFAYNMQYLTQDRVFQLINWNSEALEEVTGKKVVEYSAPGGNHPFWVNPGLAELGIKAYYYAGETGSSPTHPRLNDKFAGQAMWAFPISPFREFASLEEMERGGVKQEEVRQWIDDLIDFTTKEKVIRMIYTHPSDTRFCMGAIKAFEDKAREEQEKGRLRIAPMSNFADFLDRRAKTVFIIRKQDGYNYAIDLENPDGLEDITVAVYVGEENHVVQGGNVKTVLEDGWLYLTVTSGQTKKHLEVYRD